LDELGGDVDLALLLAAVQDLDDVRGVEGRQHPRLTREPCSEVWILCEGRAQDLEGHQSPQICLPGLENRAHAAPADSPNYLVLAEPVTHPGKLSHDTSQPRRA
jgi:hypothetical protein